MNSIADHRGLVDAATAVEAGLDAVRFARYLFSDRLYYKSNRESFPWLDTLPVDVVARLCENLGALVSAGANAHPKKLNLNARVEAGGLGFAICAEGPDAFWKTYEAIRYQSPSQKGGFYTDFGFYIRWLQRLSHRSRYRPVLDHFRDFILDRYPLAPDQEVLGHKCTQRRWYTWAELGRTYGLNSGRITRFQRAIGVSGDDLRRVVPDAHAEEFKILATGLDRKAAGRRLSVHASGIDALVDAG